VSGALHCEPRAVARRDFRSGLRFKIKEPGRRKGPRNSDKRRVVEEKEQGRRARDQSWRTDRPRTTTASRVASKRRVRSAPHRKIRRLSRCGGVWQKRQGKRCGGALKMQIQRWRAGYPRGHPITPDLRRILIGAAAIARGYVAPFQVFFRSCSGLLQVLAIAEVDCVVAGGCGACPAA
jgi:hypothetical protein